MLTRSRHCWRRIAPRSTLWKALIVLLSLPLTARAANAQELRWEALQTEHRVLAGSVLRPEPGSSFHRLRIDGTGKPSAVTVLTIERPKIAGPRYAITGQVRYEGVDSPGYLELWNHFPDGSQYFSRTLAESGPMMKLQGTSGWRSFTLPFDATGAPPPARLVVNVVLPGRGVVYLGPLKLTESVAIGESEDVDASGWTLDQRSGLLGGIAGGLIGSVGALIGLLTSLGRARRLVTWAATSLVACGAAAFVIGLFALIRSQPYAVYYPLLLIGFLSAVVPLGLMPSIRRRYEEIELRAMRSRDLG